MQRYENAFTRRGQSNLPAFDRSCTLRYRKLSTKLGAMRVAEMMNPDGKVFLKSEWGQISDDWPCVSFTKRSVGDRLRREFVAGRDVLIYVGTTNSELTRSPDHRSRLISAVVIEPRQILETRKIVPANVWASSRGAWGERWPHSMAVLSAANMTGPPYPSARALIPNAYRSFSDVANRGSIVEATGEEREAVMDLAVEPISLSLREDVLAYLNIRNSISASVDLAVKQDANRLATLIIERVKRGGEVGVKVNPLRSAPNYTDLYALIVRIWTEQRGLCALCGGRLIGGSKGMLQPSADRTDSANGAYDDTNVWITHLACNFAKNKYGLDEFEDWLAVLRGMELVVEPGSADDPVELH